MAARLGLWGRRLAGAGSASAFGGSRSWAVRVLGWPFPEGTTSTGALVALVVDSVPAPARLGSYLEDDLSVLDLEAFELAEHRGRSSGSLAASLATFCLRMSVMICVRRFLAVDLELVEVDDQLAIEERCLEIGFAVQIAAFDHRKRQFNLSSGKLTRPLT